MQTILTSHQITKLIQVIRPGFQIYNLYNLYISTFSVATKMIHADPVRSRLRNNTLQNLAGFRDAHPLKVSGNQIGNHIGDFIIAHLLSFVSPFQKWHQIPKSIVLAFHVWIPEAMLPSGKHSAPQRTQRASVNGALHMGLTNVARLGYTLGVTAGVWLHLRHD